MRLSLIIALAAPLLSAAPDAGAQAWLGKACEAQAKQRGLQGAAREQYMKTCGKETAAPGPQSKAQPKENAQQRCTREAAARGLDGVARRAFMKGCTTKG